MAVDFSTVPDVNSYVNDTGQFVSVDASTGFGPGTSSDQWSSNYVPVVPDTSSLNLPGQFNIPGGLASNGAVGASDPSGINMIHTDPTVNPTPTGGFLHDLALIASATQAGMQAFVKGSPSVAIPGARLPVGKNAGGAFSLTTPQGGVNWLVVGGAIALFAVGAVLVVKYA
jgi:hypothetical protein